MAQSQTCYLSNDTGMDFTYKVVFLVNATGQKLVRSFDSEYMAWKFVNKLKHSRRCRLVSYPLFK